MDEMIDRIVMVHPDLTHDPYNQRGNVGVVTNIDLERDDVFVEFSDSKIGIYESEALLSFISVKKLEQDIDSIIEDLFLTDYHDAKRVFQLTRSDNEKSLRNAWDIIKVNPNLRDVFTMNYRDSINERYFGSSYLDRSIDY